MCMCMRMHMCMSMSMSMSMSMWPACTVVHVFYLAGVAASYHLQRCRNTEV
jgi:hypothetical protein